MDESVATDCDRLDSVFLALWRLGIIAVHSAGGSNAEGRALCRRMYDDAGGPGSGYLGFCFYHTEDAELAIATNELSVAYGDFENKTFVARKIQQVISVALRGAGVNVVPDRDRSSRMVLRPFRWQHRTPPAPPDGVTPEPPAELIATTKAVPAASARRPRSRLSGNVNLSSTDHFWRPGLPTVPVSSEPSAPGPDTAVPAPTGPADTTERVSRTPHETAGSQLFHLGSAHKIVLGAVLALGGVYLAAELWDVGLVWVAGLFVFAIGVMLVRDGCAERQREARLERELALARDTLDELTRVVMESREKGESPVRRLRDAGLRSREAREWVLQKIDEQAAVRSV